MNYRIPYVSFLELERGVACDIKRIIPCEVPGFIPCIEFTESGYDAMGGVEGWPVFAIRGKPVSKEIAHEIIRKTDDYLYEAIYKENNIIGNLFKRAGVMPREYCIDSMFRNNWFTGPEELACGWCHPDGYIGVTDYSGVKNPFPREMLDIWYFLITQVTKELNLVVVVLDADQRLDSSKSFEEQVAFGILVLGNSIKILEKEEAIQKFTEYDLIYGDHTLVRPIRDPAVMGIKEYEPGYYSLSSLNKSDWLNCSANCKYTLDLRDNSSHVVIPAKNGKVDKNNVMYYGVPDFSLKNGPMTIKNLEAFIERWKLEDIEFEVEGDLI